MPITREPPKPDHPGAKIPIQTHMHPKTVRNLAVIAVAGWLLVAAVVLLVVL